MGQCEGDDSLENTHGVFFLWGGIFGGTASLKMMDGPREWVLGTSQ